MWKSLKAGALIALFALAPAFAQVGYGKVESPWFQQGKISAGISVSASSSPTALPSAGLVAWICNTGSTDAYLAFGRDNTVAATVNGSTWLKAGTCGNYDLLPFSGTKFSFVAAITATSTTTLTVETGIGSGPQQLASSGGGGGGGTVTQGPTGTNAAAWWVQVGDTTNGPVAVKAASTAPAAADKAFVTTESPNSPTAPFAAYSAASITRSANTTTYTANTGWNNGTPTFFSFTAACRVNGSQVLIPRIDIWSSANPTLKLTGVLWLFSAVPGTNVSDNAAFTIAAADFANLTGSFAGFPFTLANNEISAGAANSSATLAGTTFQGQCASGSTTITGMVEVTNAYVPANAEVLHVGIATVGAN